MRCNTIRTGFTLVEISVVLVIIGLIAAGILVGSSLIKSAELKQISAGFMRYRDATKQFHDKYKYFPGDFPTAHTFWDLRSECGGDPTDPLIATCNGNGDGTVGGSAGTPVQFGAEFLEPVYFWQHLTNAGFIEDNYSGKGEHPVNWWQPGVNLPQGADKDSGYTFSYAQAGSIFYNVIYPELGSISGQTFPARYGHILVYGNPQAIGNRRAASGVSLSGAEAFSLDQKMDDGHPGLGDILAIPNTSDGTNYICVTSTDSTVAKYRSDVKTKACAIIYITGF